MIKDQEKKIIKNFTKRIHIDFKKSIKFVRSKILIQIKHTVLVLLEPRGSIFHSGFLGGILFKFEEPRGVFEVGLY